MRSRKHFYLQEEPEPDSEDIQAVGLPVPSSWFHLEGGKETIKEKMNKSVKIGSKGIEL